MSKFKDIWKDMHAEKMDEYMDTLGIKMKQKNFGIDNAGPIPGSLLAEQDLEGRVEDVVTENRMNEPFRVLADEEIIDNFKTMNEKPKHKVGDRVRYKKDMWIVVSVISAYGSHKYVIDNPEEDKEITVDESMISKSMEKGSVGTYSVWYYDKTGAQKCAVFNNVTDSGAFVRDLVSMGYKQSEIKIVTKGQVEQTGKELKEASNEAEEADTKTEVKSVVDNIKAIQLKRQNATIEARQKSEGLKNKSFKDIWNKLKK